MYSNFTQYWEQRGSILMASGVTEDVARMIWCDAADTVERVVTGILLKQ